MSYAIARMLEVLERRQVITTDPEEARQCCGIDRDDEGFCVYRPGHPVYVDLFARPSGDREWWSGSWRR